MIKNKIKALVIWAARTPLLSLPRRWLATVTYFAIESGGRVIISYDDPQRRPVLDLVRQIKRQRRMILDDNEAYQIAMAVRKTQKISGDLAEVGVFQGGSAKLICESNCGKPLHLFDTFEGIPKVEEIDTPAFYKGQFAASLEDVQTYLKGYIQIYFYKGLFPETGKPVEEKKFSFVHFDVDTYESTLDCIQFFYPRMNQGGIILSHDYINHYGVRKAFDEFFKDKKEPVIEMSGTQCLVVKS
jgi:O-methyltransferase